MTVTPSDVGDYLNNLDISERIESMEKRDWSTWYKGKTTKLFIDFLIDRRLDLQIELAHIPNVTPEKYSELRGRYEETGFLIKTLKDLINPNEDTQQSEGE